MTGSPSRRGRGAALLAAALLALLLPSSCAPTRPFLGAGERAEAERFFRERWLAAPFPARSSFSGTAGTASGAWPVLVGVEALAPDRETVGVYSPFGHEVVALRNDGAKLSVEAGPLAGPLASLDRTSVAVERFSLGRVFSGAPALEPAEGEYYRGDGGEWVYEGKGQTLRSDAGRQALAAARYRLYGQELSVAYPGWDGKGAPPDISFEGGGAVVRVRRDAE